MKYFILLCILLPVICGLPVAEEEPPFMEDGNITQSSNITIIRPPVHPSPIEVPAFSPISSGSVNTGNEDVNIVVASGCMITMNSVIFAFGVLYMLCLQIF